MRQTYTKQASGSGGVASKLIRAMAGALVLAVALSLCGFWSECSDIRQRMLRLHVLAHSDSEADQQLKLLVRDTVVETSANLFDQSADREQAREEALAALPDIEKAAQQRVYDEGFDYGVRAELCDMYFTTRKYDNVTLPAGHYEAVRITIGEGGGENWWCVVFPPLCVSAAVDSAALSDVLNPEQQDIVTSPGKYEIRFKTVEIFEGIRHWFANRINGD